MAKAMTKVKRKRNKVRRQTKYKGYTIKEVEYDNKSRKGWYVYIKKPKERANVYKLPKGKTTQDLEFISDVINIKTSGGLKYKKKGITKVTPEKPYRTKKPYRVRYKADSILKKGIYQTHLKNASLLNPDRIKESYKHLLKGAVIGGDEELLNMLIQDTNIEKLKKRFEFKVDIRDRSGKIIGRVGRSGDRKMEEVIQEVKGIVKSGTEIKDSSPKIMNELKQIGYSYEHKNNGVADTIDILIILRKAK